MGPRRKEVLFGAEEVEDSAGESEGGRRWNWECEWECEKEGDLERDKVIAKMEEGEKSRQVIS